jgi:uncharacterized protein (TIGR00299 family) protein
MSDRPRLPPAALRGATLYFDCFAGLAGDMVLAALLDLGVPEQAVRDALSRLLLTGWELRVYPTLKGVMAATKVDVLCTDATPSMQKVTVRPGHLHDRGHSHSHEGHEHREPARLPFPTVRSYPRTPLAHAHAHPHVHEPAGAPTRSTESDPHRPEHLGHPHTHYGEIRALIQRSALDADVAARALQIFDRIAEVEAALHGVTVAEVTFHEVGAIDSIIDIVGVAAALSWLQPARVVARPVPLGSGMVQTAHGLLPIPAPATLALLKGAPVEHGGAPCELTTPTGAAILAANVSAYGPLPAMRVLGIGHGAGTRELSDRPNLLRVIAGEESPVGPSAAVAQPGERCVVLEANIDDMNPQLYEPLLEGLLLAGARDVWLTPVHMKKGRPGIIVGVLADPELRHELTQRLLRESTSLGVRSHEVSRTMLAREIVQVATEFGLVAVKLGRDPASGELWNLAPEYASCREQARAHDVPLKRVYAAALAAFPGLSGPPPSKPPTP